jgi:pyruvate carboxylase
MEQGEELQFTDSRGKPHQLTLLSIQEQDVNGVSIVRYVLDSEIMSTVVQVAKPNAASGQSIPMANPDDPCQVGAPSNGDLWVMYVNPGDLVKKGEELFNISIMKQEKAVIAPVDGIVKRVLRTADYRESKQMTPVREGELIVELAPVPHCCAKCGKPMSSDTFEFCPFCGKKN